MTGKCNSFCNTSSDTSLAALLHQIILEMHKERLVKELNIEPIVEELQEKHLISPNDIKEIRRKLKQTEKVDEFIHFLQHASDMTYRTFLDVLRHTNQKDLLELLGKLSIMCVYIMFFHDSNKALNTLQISEYYSIFHSCNFFPVYEVSPTKKSVKTKRSQSRESFVMQQIKVTEYY